jgi:aminoglycoside phosphotransferase (APT) family kinase protein
MSGDLDIERPGELEAYLRASGRIGRDEPVSVRRLAGGVSNRVMLVESGERGGWVVKQALPKLRVAVDWFSDPARIGREALGLRYLAEMLPAGAVPRLIFLDEPRHVLAMSAVPPPCENWKGMLLRGEVDLGLVDQWGRMLGTIHREGSRRRAELAPVFEDRSFFESLRVEAYYEYTATRVGEAAGFIGELVGEMRGRRVSLVHGDWSPKNVLVTRATKRSFVPQDRLRDGATKGEERESGGGRLVLLDHEVIHFGDPGFDLGFSLTHLLSKGHHLGAARERFAQAARVYWRTYRGELGEAPWAGEVEGWAVRHTLGCLLARVAGRSVLEYLSDSEKARQREVVVGLMREVPSGVEGLVDSFLERV